MPVLALALVLSAVEAFADPPGQPPAQPPAPKISSADELLGQMEAEGSWSIVMMDSPGRKITFNFGDLGKRVVELKWAHERNASLGEMHQRLGEIYEEESGDFGSGKAPPGGINGRKPGASLSAQAYTEMRRAVANLNKGKFTYANNHLSLMESAAGGLSGPEKEDYKAAAGTLRRAHAIMASDDALRRLVIAAERGDFSERETLKTELRSYARQLGVNMGRFLLAASDIWEAYQHGEIVPKGSGGDLKAALAEIDVAEKLVQGRFRRADYTSAFERARGLSRGLSRKDRAALVARLRKLAAMWNKAAANPLAFALMSSLSPDAAVRGQLDALLDQARWKGKQAARAQNLAKELSTLRD